MHFSRRRFLHSALVTGGLLSFGGLVPGFLRAGAAASQSDTGKVLVVIQLTGGNDGLNTVAPAEHELYRKLRPKLALAKSDVLSIEGELGFHPAFKGFANLLEAQQLAIVQGVGYPDPNRSHFESMDIWHSCRRKQELRPEGWLGHYLSGLPAAARAGAPALHLGGEKQPAALASLQVAVPTVQKLDQFRLNIPREEALASLRENSKSAEGNGNLLSFVQSTQKSALQVSQQLSEQGQVYSPKSPYPDYPLAEKLKTVAQLIHSGLGTRVYYVELDGFDTHSQQAPAHAGLLRQLGDSVHAFVQDMVEQQSLDRVCVMCFSEFGRRVAENASEGTDHGTAAPMFFAGGGIRAGLVGAHPSLEDLDAGDLKFHTDFRRVYASVLENWLEVPAPEILGGKFSPLELFS